MHIWSSNPEKARAERFFAAYSLVWPVLFGGWAASGWHLKAGDAGNMLVTLLIGAPNVLYPLWSGMTPPGRSHVESYWFKFLLWLGIFSFVASYFWTEYFFDVLGMKYHFPHLEWNLDSVLVGSGRQRVPLMMYVHGWYFFVTYHTYAIICIRLARTHPLLRPYKRLGPAIATFGSAFFFAAGEIYFTTLEAIKDQFAYRDMDWALTWGALGYSCYFLASFPLLQGMDEEKRWTLAKTMENSLAAGMLGFILLDLTCWFLVSGWRDARTNMAKDWWGAVASSTAGGETK